MKENIIKKQWKSPAQQKYYYKNKEELKRKEKIYRANNQDKVKQWKKNYYWNHKEEIALYNKEWKAKQPPVVKPVKHCNWCLQPLGKKRSKFCSDTCNDKFKIYKKRMGPIWMWRLYSKYKIWKIFYQYIPKIKRLFVKKIPKFFLKFFKKAYKELQKLRTHLKYFKYKTYKAKVCGHWRVYRHYGLTEYKYKKNFCSDKCKHIHENKIAEAKKQRNLAAWGTEHRPDEETRRIIKNKKHLEWDKQKKIDDPGYRVIRRTRLRMKKVLGRGFTRKQRGEVSVYEQLGVKNGTELRAHLESKWQPGMTWENYGKQDGWVIDHIIPLKYYKDNFDLAKDIEVQKKAFGIQNLQPLWWLENAKKSAKLNYNETKYRYK